MQYPGRKSAVRLRWNRFGPVIDRYRNFSIGHWDANTWNIPSPEFMPPPIPGWLDVKRVIAKTMRLHELLNDLVGLSVSVVPHYQQVFENAFLEFWNLSREEVLEDLIFESRNLLETGFESTVENFRTILLPTLL
jgi:hypothetical protein